MSRDPVDTLLEQKRAARKEMVAERRRASTKLNKERWTRWIKKGDGEIAALVSVQKQLIALRAIKAAAKTA